MTSWYKAEALSEASTTSGTMVDVPDAQLVFTPASGETWMVFVTGVMRSSSTVETSAEFRLTINGVEVDYWGIQNNNAGTPNGAGFFIFDRITGTTAPQTIQLQFLAATGTTFVSTVRIIAVRVPAGADFQFGRSDAIVQTSGADAVIGSYSFTPSSEGLYYAFAHCSHREFPGGSTSQVYVEDVGESNHPDAPTGTYHSNSRDPWSTFTTFWRVNLPVFTQNFNLRFTSSGSGSETSQHRYRKVMFFRADAFEQDNYNESTGQSTTTVGTFQTKNLLAVSAPPVRSDFLVLQSARISGDTTSTTARKSGELRVGGTAVVRTDHRINRDGSSTQGFHHFVSYADIVQTDNGVTYTNGFLSPNGATVQIAESIIGVLRIGASVQEANAPFFGMVA